MEATGYISEIGDFNGELGAYVFVPLQNIGFIERQGITEVGVSFRDSRVISDAQRRKIHALIGDITDYICAPGPTQRTRAERETLRQMQLLYVIDLLDPNDKEHNKHIIRRQLTTHYCSLLGIDLFSLKNVDMTTAREFIDWLVEFCVVHGIPCIDTLLNRCEDIGRYLYACVANRRCAICGKRADIHEVDKVQRGRDRRKIHHLGQRVQPLCRIHHNEVEGIGQQSFDKKYHLDSIRLDEYLCDVLRWKK